MPVLLPFLIPGGRVSYTTGNNLAALTKNGELIYYISHIYYQ
jgi:hypothetical protein